MPLNITRFIHLLSKYAYGQIKCNNVILQRGKETLKKRWAIVEIEIPITSSPYRGSFLPSLFISLL